MTSLPAYSQWSPTTFDCPGLGLEDRQDWLVAPVVRTRDSGPDAESNFWVLEGRLNAEDNFEESWEVHRFGHWGPGWVEIIIVKPGTKAAQIVQEAADALEDYPLLDDEDYSRRELEKAEEDWRDWGEADAWRALRNTVFHDPDDQIEIASTELFDYLCDHGVITFSGGLSMSPTRLEDIDPLDMLAACNARVFNQEVEVKDGKAVLTPYISLVMRKRVECWCGETVWEHMRHHPGHDPRLGPRHRPGVRS